VFFVFCFLPSEVRMLIPVCVRERATPLLSTGAQCVCVCMLACVLMGTGTQLTKYIFIFFKILNVSLYTRYCAGHLF